MRKMKLFSVFVLLALLLSVGVSAFAEKAPPQVGTSYPSDKMTMFQEPTPENCELDSLVAQAPDVDLQPGVREFIAGNYLAHTAEFPDPSKLARRKRRGFSHRVVRVLCQNNRFSPAPSDSWYSMYRSIKSEVT